MHFAEHAEKCINVYAALEILYRKKVCGDVDARNTCFYLSNIMFCFILHEIIYICECIH